MFSTKLFPELHSNYSKKQNHQLIYLKFLNSQLINIYSDILHTVAHAYLAMIFAYKNISRVTLLWFPHCPIWRVIISRGILFGFIGSCRFHSPNTNKNRHGMHSRRTWKWKIENGGKFVSCQRCSLKPIYCIEWGGAKEVNRCIVAVEDL